MEDELYETSITPIAVKSPKNLFKPVPVFEPTRDRLLNNMMKKDTYDSFINKILDVYIKHKDDVGELK
jgi:hypothetical protein